MNPSRMTEDPALASTARPPSGGVQVRIDGVTKRFTPPRGEPVQAVERVDLTIAAGEFVSVLGPSGCGKSTLMSMIAGLADATTGEIRIDGQRIAGPYTPAGVVFQRDLLLEWRDCLANILIQFEMRGKKAEPYRARALELLEMVGIRDFHGRYPRELSGGMRQRVSICRALAHDPGLLLMDEPFGALDAMTREQLNDDLADICARTNKTVIFITHSITEAIFLGDRVVVMSARPGRVVADFKIDLPKPRVAEVRGTEEFAVLTAKVRGALEAEGVL
jgi:NitT/TauT family transport system ATP-binding protein